MSWLTRSLTDTLLLDPEPDSITRAPTHDPAQAQSQAQYSDPFNEGRGVKDDFEELTQTLTRQFWGVASFLAPPPPPPPPPPRSRFRGGGVEGQGAEGCGIDVYDARVEEEEEDLRGDRDDFDVRGKEVDLRCNGDCADSGDRKEEDLRCIGDRLESRDRGEEGGRSNRDCLDLGDEEEEEEDLGTSYNNGDYCNGDEDSEEEVEEGVIGVTEEALTFAQNIGHHPETWLDFPLEEEDEEGFEDFHISDSQYKHALAIQRLVPTLLALKIELCPVHMSEGYFWMVYFVLLHSRLNKNDADQLSSSELVQARSMWREELQKRAKLHTDWFDRSTFHLQDSTLSPTILAREECDSEFLEDSDTRHLSFNTYNSGSRPYHEPSYNETEKQIVESDKAKSAETPSEHSEGDLLTFQSSQVLQDSDDEDDWVQETEELDGYSASGIMVNEEDVSFSDLEEDSDWTLPVRSK